MIPLNDLQNDNMTIGTNVCKLAIKVNLCSETYSLSVNLNAGAESPFRKASTN